MYGGTKVKQKYELLKVYADVNNILNKIDFNELFTGFHKYKFALYNRAEIAIDGYIIPYQEEFKSNTSIFYKGEYIAIWNMELDNVEDIEILAYCLVHEMFHCYQEDNNEKRYPNDMELLNYPDDIDNYLGKYNENLYLSDAYELHDIKQLHKFFQIRDNRLKIYPDFVCQEMKAETLEGMAEYIGLKALKTINEEKYNSLVKDYLTKLRLENELLFDIRRISYYSGTIFLLCLDLFEFEIKNNFDDDKTAYEQNHMDSMEIVAEIHPYDFVQRCYTEILKEKEAKINKHISNSTYTKCYAFICGYDPMNMFCFKNMIYCSHFVCLNENDNVRGINDVVVLELAKDSNRDIVGYYI